MNTIKLSLFVLLIVSHSAFGQCESKSEGESLHLTFKGRKFERITQGVPYPTAKVTISVPESECEDVFNCQSSHATVTKTSINNLSGSFAVSYLSKLSGNNLFITLTRVFEDGSISQEEIFDCD